MIRPLRRRHRWAVVLLALGLFGAALVSRAYQPPAPRMDRLPAELEGRR